MSFVCPCGTAFTPAVYQRSIQLLCDPCSLAHLNGHGFLARAWVPSSNVISLFRSAPGGAPSGVGGIESGVACGEVGGVTPVPLLSPLAPGARRG